MNGKITQKQYNTHISQVEDEEQIIELRIASLKRDLESKQKQKQKLITKKQRIKERPLTISEHAYVRYFQRIEKIDTEEIKNKILCPEVLKLIETLGPTGTYPHPDGYTILLRNNVVVTLNY